MPTPSSTTTLLSLDGLTAGEQRQKFATFMRRLIECFSLQRTIDPARIVKGWLCLILTQLQWQAIAGNIITPAVPANPAADPPTAAVPAVFRAFPSGAENQRPGANANAATLAFYQIDLKRTDDFLLDEAAATNMFLVAIGPALTEAIGAPGTGTANMNLRQLVAALTHRLGTYTTADVSAMTDGLEAPMVDSFEAHLTSQLNTHALLFAAGQTLSEHTKLKHYAAATAAHVGITTARKAWLVDNPCLAQQSFADLATYLEAQAPNINATPTVAQVGYQPKIGDSLAVALAAASPANTSITAADLHELLDLLRQRKAGDSDPTIAGARTERRRQGGDKPFCPIHGHGGHTGPQCRTMAADPVKYAEARKVTAPTHMTEAIRVLKAAGKKPTA
jgi:hypothetical protein